MRRHAGIVSISFNCCDHDVANSWRDCNIQVVNKSMPGLQPVFRGVYLPSHRCMRTPPPVTAVWLSVSIRSHVSVILLSNHHHRLRGSTAPSCAPTVFRCLMPYKTVASTPSPTPSTPTSSVNRPHLHPCLPFSLSLCFALILCLPVQGPPLIVTMVPRYYGLLNMLKICYGSAVTLG